MPNYDGPSCTREDQVSGSDTIPGTHWLSVLTSVTDHYATFGTKVIPASAREGSFALDEIFALRDRASELAIAGHTTDTAGFTDLLFGVYDVAGLGFSPRIRAWPTSDCGAWTTPRCPIWWSR